MGIKTEGSASGIDGNEDIKPTGILKSSSKTNQQDSKDGEPQDKGGSKYSTNTSSVTTHEYGYEGMCKDIGVILALRTERYSKKVVYSVFIERLKNHVLVSFNDAKDIVELLETGKDPESDIIAKAPKDLTGGKEDSKVEEWMNLEKVKIHVKRLQTLGNNKQTLYGLIWGQCSSGLQEVIKADDEYKAKAKVFDCVWLLEKTNLVSAGVDEKANKYCTLIRAITAFATMRQGPTEPNNSFRKRVEANATTLELSGGAHIMYSPQISTAQDAKNPKEEETKVEKDRFKAVIMILRADPARYSSLQESLFEGVYKGRD